MSAVVKTRRRKNLTMSTIVLWIVLGFAAVFFLFSYGQELLLAHSLNDKAAVQRVENQRQQDDITRLKAQLEYYQSDKYIEQRAREDLNLRRPEEQILIPVAGTQTSTGGATVPMTGTNGTDSDTRGPAADATPTSPQDEANWQKWLQLFAP